MTITETKAKSILRKHKKIDSWFISHAGMNLYRGCQHNCVYCDGRSERYYVTGEFGRDMTVKTNAIEILRREFERWQKQPYLNSGFLMLGGGVGDSFQPVEQTYRLTHQVLQLIHEYGFPVHILTKATLIERDLALIKKIHDRKQALVSMSFSSVDAQVSQIFEPHVPPPEQRLATLQKFKKAGVPVGIFLMPVIPFVTDNQEQIEAVFKAAKQSEIDFIIGGGMTLKTGRQKEYFLQTLKKHYPQLRTNYENLYQDDRYGQATGDYYPQLNQTFYQIARHYKLPLRIPLPIFDSLLNATDRVITLLEHIDYYCQLQGRHSPYGYAAHSLSKLNRPLAAMKGHFRELKGIGPTTERLINEILETGKSSYLARLQSRSG